LQWAFVFIYLFININAWPVYVYLN
jgi:hypothetical protein